MNGAWGVGDVSGIYLELQIVLIIDQLNHCAHSF